MTIDLTAAGAVVGILAGVVAILSGAFVALRWFIRAELHENSRDTKAVLHEVKNGHETNLREDIDQVMEAAADAKALAADAKAAIHRTEEKVDGHIATSAVLLEAGEKREAVIVGFQAHLDERQERLEQSVADLSSAIKTVAESTPPPDA